MAQITYDDKVYLNENANVPAINKVQDSDMNEIKNTINGIDAGTDVVTNLVVGSVRTKNIFDQSTIVVGDITSGYPTLRLSSRQALWLEPGTYTFSSNISSSYRFSIGVQNVGVPPLSSYPTYSYDSGWQTSSPFTFTTTTAGYLTLGLSRTDNSAFNNTDLTNLFGFNYQIEVGNTATTFTQYQNLNAVSNSYNSYLKGETRIGTWIDGKPLYRTVLTTTTPSSSSVATIGTINDTDTVINLHGYLSTSNQRVPLNFVYNTEQVSLYKEGGAIKCKVTASSYQSKSCIVICEYTKTTD